jgi:hypothetical protein
MNIMLVCDGTDPRDRSADGSQGPGRDILGQFLVKP